MNRLLVFVVLILVPIAIFTTPDNDKEVLKTVESETVSLDLPVEDEDGDGEAIQVALSMNGDKSDAFTMDLEDYVVGVVAGEMPASFSMEALKAQAVASRTFALYKMDSIYNYVLSATINDQVYLTPSLTHASQKI